MSTKLNEIFDYHQDRDISVSFGKQEISEKVMTKEAFTSIVSKMLKGTSTGEPFKSIKQMHRYYEV